MSLLDDENSFHSYNFEADYGVNINIDFSGDSARQYSREQQQREKRAIELVELKEKREFQIDEYENTDTTISEDLADGQVSKFDACLKILSEDDKKLILPSDYLEDDEIYIIENSSNTTGLGDHALQDYQMQLMLLEQQNKKRLLIARQEQDALADSRPPPRFLPPPRFRPLPRSRPQLGLGFELADSYMARKQASEGIGPSKTKRKRRYLGTSSPNEVEDAATINGGFSNTNKEPPAEVIPKHAILVYRVECDHSHMHPVSTFYDLPKPTEEFDNDDVHEVHFQGGNPVINIQALMENEEDDIGFVVLRTIQCSAASIMIAVSGANPAWTEAIYMKSRNVKNTLPEITTCYFQPVQEQRPPIPPMPSQYYSGSRKPTPSYEQNQIHPASLFFFHHRRPLRSWSSENQETSSHVNGLLEWVDMKYGAEFLEADNLFAAGLASQAHISKLFKPNELIVSGAHGKPAAFALQEWPIESTDGWITLNCWSFQTDGSRFTRKRSVLSIPPLHRETKKITDLVAYPLHYASPELRQLILDRGKKQWSLRNAIQVTYKGWNVGRDQFYPDARFMIDHTIYHKMHPLAKAFQFKTTETTHRFDQMPAFLSAEQTPSELSLLLMAPDIHGFYLNEKKWIKLFVDCIEPVTWNKKAFERLVLPNQTKDLVRALVAVRTSQRGIKQGLGAAGKRTDITGGKGNGLIMLLHGGPGTGKTLTGESVAEIAEMPLYRVTCGDIGTNAEAVERYLNTVLHLGKTWNCVLLLDEADVFLEERSMADLKRNSLVSVFLRILEYYDGILILTSNRVGMFDEAFKSRIQVALHYENLSRSSRKKIWQNFFEMLEEDEEDANLDELRFHLDDLAGLELNGRQIRNVLTTARQLAIYRNERLDWKHLEQALAVSSDFSAYLKRMQGHTDDQRARDIGLR